MSSEDQTHLGATLKQILCFMIHATAVFLSFRFKLQVQFLHSLSYCNPTSYCEHFVIIHTIPDSKSSMLIKFSKKSPSLHLVFRPLETLLLVHLVHYNNGQKQIKIEKVRAPQSRGVKNSKRQTVEYYKADSWPPKKIPCMLFCHY